MLGWPGLFSRCTQTVKPTTQDLYSTDWLTEWLIELHLLIFLSVVLCGYLNVAFSRVPPPVWNLVHALKDPCNKVPHHSALLPAHLLSNSNYYHLTWRPSSRAESPKYYCSPPKPENKCTPVRTNITFLTAIINIALETKSSPFSVSLRSSHHWSAMPP